jgi:hypothetical protein
MRTFLPDTNAIIDYGRNRDRKAKLDGAVAAGSKFVIAPPTLTELTVGVVKGSTTHFAQNKAIFEWLKAHSANILEPPRPFMGQVSGFPSRRGNVTSAHHEQRIELVAGAADYADFLKRKNAPGSVWSDIEQSAVVHKQMLDNEFAVLSALAKKAPGSFDLATEFSKTFEIGGQSPDPKIFKDLFSAAFEYGEVTIAKIRAGANPRKNDQGRYGDFQLLFYLAEPDIELLTSEDFSRDITHSPQRSRIVKVDSLP